MSYPAFVRQTRTQVSTLLFAIDIVGNMGAPLRHGFTSSEASTEFTDEDEWRNDEETPVTPEPPVTAYELQMLSDQALDPSWSGQAVEDSRRRDTFHHDVG